MSEEDVKIGLRVKKGDIIRFAPTGVKIIRHGKQIKHIRTSKYGRKFVAGRRIGNWRRVSSTKWRNDKEKLNVQVVENELNSMYWSVIEWRDDYPASTVYEAEFLAKKEDAIKFAEYYIKNERS